jgi:hypothetical protein
MEICRHSDVPERVLDDVDIPLFLIDSALNLMELLLEHLELGFQLFQFLLPTFFHDDYLLR